MSEHLLDVRMIKEVIAFASGDQGHASAHDLSNDCGIAVLPVQADQGRLGRESKLLQVGCDCL